MKRAKQTGLIVLVVLASQFAGSLFLSWTQHKEWSFLDFVTDYTFVAFWCAFLIFSLLTHCFLLLKNKAKK